MSADPSAGATRTECSRSPSAGRTSSEGSNALVSKSKLLKCRLPSLKDVGPRRLIPKTGARPGLEDEAAMQGLSDELHGLVARIPHP
ncbi:hypothetical protein GCM10010402_39140 [Actinomadura luteofluorescens]